MKTIATITVIIGAVAGVLITAQVMIEMTLHGKPIRRQVKGLTAGPAAAPYSTLSDRFLFNSVPFQSHRIRGFFLSQQMRAFELAICA